MAKTSSGARVYAVCVRNDLQSIFYIFQIESERERSKKHRIRELSVRGKMNRDETMPVATKMK